MACAPREISGGTSESAQTPPSRPLEESVAATVDRHTPVRCSTSYGPSDGISMNRRAFKATCLPGLVQQVLPESLALRHQGVAPHRPARLLRCSHQAMATVFELILPWQIQGSRWACQLFDLIDELEAQLTVYRDDSDVSRINQFAAKEAIEVETRLFELFERCEQLTRETWGAFDITAGPLIRAWGFWKRKGEVPTPSERQQAWQRVGMHRVILDRSRRSIRFATQGVELNLGSIGKGYALDRCFEVLREMEVSAALMHAGGSSVRAVGHPLGAGGRGWPVGIRHPWDAQRRLAIVRLRDRALATSAATYQYFEYNRRKLGHLLDPRSGWPAEGVASATAIARTAAEADALATAFYVLGLEKTRRYCALHPDVGAIVLLDDSEVPVVINLPESEVQVLTSN